MLVGRLRQEVLDALDITKLVQQLQVTTIHVPTVLQEERAAVALNNFLWPDFEKGVLPSQVNTWSLQVN